MDNNNSFVDIMETGSERQCQNIYRTPDMQEQEGSHQSNNRNIKYSGENIDEIKTVGSEQEHLSDFENSFMIDQAPKAGDQTNFEKAF